MHFYFMFKTGEGGGKRLLSLQFRVQCTSSDVVETTGDSWIQPHYNNTLNTKCHEFIIESNTFLRVALTKEILQVLVFYKLLSWNEELIQMLHAKQSDVISILEVLNVYCDVTAQRRVTSPTACFFYSGAESKVVKETTQKESPHTSLYLFPTDEYLLTQLDVWAAPLEDVCIRGCLRTCVYTILRP